MSSARDPRDVSDVFTRGADFDRYRIEHGHVDLDELRADASEFLTSSTKLMNDAMPIRFKASEILEGSVIHLSVHLTFDWRFRLGLALMKLGARIMRSKIKTEEPQ
jgi:hypothetical protein